MVMSFSMMYIVFLSIYKKINYKGVSSRIRDVTCKPINCMLKRKMRTKYMGNPSRRLFSSFFNFVDYIYFVLLFLFKIYSYIAYLIAGKKRCRT